MLPLRRVVHFFTLLTILVVSGSGNQAAPTDDISGNINLAGVPGPFSFGKFCRLNTKELWVVGGDGTVQYNSTTGAVQRRVTDQALNAVYFVNSETGWVVGESGTIMHTQNSGYSWTRQRSGVTRSLRGIKCTDKRRCWTVGSEGTILNTDDGGANWVGSKSAASTELFSVDFVDDRVGWVTGADGLILHTRTGGQTWETQRAQIILHPDGAFATPTDLVTVDFVDHSLGWVAGAGGVARTLDGGRTWQPIQIEDGSFVGLATADGRTVWAINSNGANYITNNSGLTWEPITEQSLVKRQPKRFAQLSSMPVRKRRPN